MNKIDDETEEIIRSLGDTVFFSLSQLKELGLFHSTKAVAKALDTGALKFIKVSERRRLIPRCSLTDFIHKNRSWINPKSDLDGALRTAKQSKESP